MVCGTDFSFFDIILLQHYSINTLLNSFYSRQQISTSFFGTAEIYICSSATECSHRGVAMGKSAWH